MLKVLEMISKQKLREQKKLWSSLREIWYFEKIRGEYDEKHLSIMDKSMQKCPPPLFPCYKDVF